MTPRERFHRTMNFEPVDRVPLWEMGAWNETMKRWRAEAPPGVDPEAYFHGDPREHCGINFAQVPPFERRILSDDGYVRLLVDDRGVTCRELSEKTETSMPHWLDFPVKTRADWEEMKKRYDPRSPQRYPADWAARVERWGKRDFPLQIYGGRDVGFFGPIRGWMGAEGAMYAFYDDPNMMHDMMEFIADFTIETCRRAFRDLDIDYFVIWEDMAFKTASLISPAMFRQFMLPRYQKLTAFIRSQGVRTIMVDSDGHIEKLIPLWLEGGVTCIYPMECAAGMDVLALRKEYGRDLAMTGGLDKRALARDKDAIERELTAKLPVLLPQGGYIPELDHSFPPDVPWENFRYYAERKRELIEKG